MRKFFLLLAPFLLLAAGFRMGPTHSLTGKIVDEQGNHLASVSIVLKGTNTRTSSASDGTFSLSVPDKNGILIFSSVGFDTKEEKIEGRTIINVVLKSSATNLQEVVVIGYGTTKKTSISGSVSHIKQNMPTALQGKVRGMMIMKNKVRQKRKDFNTESYDNITENNFKRVTDDPLSTFSIDVDAASYSIVRRFINEGKLPPAGAVRVEEMINYFRYQYPQPQKEDPISLTTEISDCPWNTKHRLVMIGMQGKKIASENLPASNFVLLIDVSGSMNDENKLPLVKSSLKLLVDQLREQDKVAIVVYAGAAGLVLPSVNGDNKIKIKDAIEQLEAGGSTAGGQGIKLAYKIARENFVKEGNNRVILCTDGDFNVGASSDDEMERMIEQERKSGVFLTVLGYGMGNYKDSKMQKLANKGNGNHAYIDGLNEAKKVLVNEFGGTMFTIAKDVKLQIEFNPEKVQGYRLIGYENRLLNKEDFNNDQKDAGELGSGHTVTALYEIIPTGVETSFLNDIDDLRYRRNKTTKTNKAVTGEIMNIKIRYKEPEGHTSQLVSHAVIDSHLSLEQASDNFRFAASVAQFGMLLRKSDFRQNASYASVLQLAENGRAGDEGGYRKEFIELVRKASGIQVKEDQIASAED